MISSRQIKAARALLGWTQAELADAAGLHFNAINKIENEIGEPRLRSLERIRGALETAGVKFRGQRGVEIKEDVFEIARFEGKHFIKQHIDDIVLNTKGPEDEVLNIVTDEQLYQQADARENERYYKHMKRTGFRERYLTSKRHAAFTNPDKKAYRWLPENVLGTIGYVIYGDRVAFVQWGTKELLMIRNKSLSQAFRGQFEFLWQQAKTFGS